MTSRRSSSATPTTTTSWTRVMSPKNSRRRPSFTQRHYGQYPARSAGAPGKVVSVEPRSGDWVDAGWMDLHRRVAPFDSWRFARSTPRTSWGSSCLAAESIDRWSASLVRPTAGRRGKTLAFLIELLDSDGSVLRVYYQDAVPAAPAGLLSLSDVKSVLSMLRSSASLPSAKSQTIRGAVPAPFVPRHVFLVHWRTSFGRLSRRPSRCPSPIPGRSPAASPRVFRPMHGGTHRCEARRFAYVHPKPALVGGSALACCQSYRRSDSKERTMAAITREADRRANSNRYDDEIHLIFTSPGDSRANPPSWFRARLGDGGDGAKSCCRFVLVVLSSIALASCSEFLPASASRRPGRSLDQDRGHKAHASWRSWAD